MTECRVWTFGDDIDTDAIIPGRYLDNYSPEFLAKHALEGADPEFSSKVSKGDIIVAGSHFGIGSSREQAPIALKAAGINIVIAESFARIFFRNAVNQGMLPLISPGCSGAFDSGEKVKIDVEGRIVESIDRPGRRISFQAPSGIVSEIHASGGLINRLRAELAKDNRA